MLRSIRLAAAVAILGLAAQGARGQDSNGFGEFCQKIKQAEGKMTEAELFKLLPRGLTMEVRDGIESDYVVAMEQVRRIRVEFVKGKVKSASGSFSDAVKSSGIGPEKLKGIALGMKRAEVEKLIQGKKTNNPVSFGGSFEETREQDGKQEVTTCQWSQGRWLKVHVKDGKVLRADFAY